MQSVKRHAGQPEEKRRGWIVGGWISLAIAFIGVFVPVFPQVPFALLAAFFFSKGSPRLHHWLLNHRQFGPALRDWEMDRVIRPRMKVVSVLAMLGGAGLTYWRFHERMEWVLPILASFAAAIVFVLTRKSRTKTLLG